MTRPDTAPVRAGEELPLDRLREVMSGQVAGKLDALEIEQFPGGFSNLTYLAMEMFAREVMPAVQKLESQRASA